MIQLYNIFSIFSQNVCTSFYKWLKSTSNHLSWEFQRHVRCSYDEGHTDETSKLTKMSVQDKVPYKFPHIERHNQTWIKITWKLSLSLTHTQKCSPPPPNVKHKYTRIPYKLCSFSPNVEKHNQIWVISTSNNLI